MCQHFVNVIDETKKKDLKIVHTTTVNAFNTVPCNAEGTSVNASCYDLIACRNHGFRHGF